MREVYAFSALLYIAFALLGSVDWAQNFFDYTEMVWNSEKYEHNREHVEKGKRVKRLSKSGSTSA